MKNKALKSIANPLQDLRLALDIGTNSIGWALYQLDKKHKEPNKIVSAGVRIFPSGRKPKDSTTLNADRRKFRLQRRQRDRSLQRKNQLLYLLRKHNLFPEDSSLSKKLKPLNPYKLRAEGLDKKLDIYHFGRALFHINQKRGFKSNRKTANKDESGLISQSVEESKILMKKLNCRTYGEFLYHKWKELENRRKTPGSLENHWILSRRMISADTKDKYVVYANRKMMEEEFNQLWDSQAHFHNILKNKDLKKEIFKSIFFQRPLKKPPVGVCLLTKEKRIARALPSFQKFRILKELNNLSYIDKIGKSHSIIKMKQGIKFRNKIIEELFFKKTKVTFASLKKAFRNFFESEVDFLKFNLDSFNRDFLEGDKTSVILKKIITDWDNWDLKKQDQFIKTLEGENKDIIKSDDEVLDDLNELYNGRSLTKEIFKECIKKLNQLPQGYGKYSEKAVQKLLPFLEKGQLEHEALTSAGFQQPFNKKDEEMMDKKLPPYQKILSDHCMELIKKEPKSITFFKNGKENLIKMIDDKQIKLDFTSEWEKTGCLSKEFLETYRNKIGKKIILVKNVEKRISNPTVHIAFNQLRLLVNDIIRVYGKPLQTVVETARDLPLGKKTKDDLEKSYKEDKKRNDKAREAIEEFGQENNKANRIRWRLWNEQKKTCLYTGGRISQRDLWTADLEVDHILPWSKTLDDAFSNKALVYKSSNQNKSNKTPFEYFSQNEANWKDILDRVKNLPENKQWRFESNALDRFSNNEGDFLAIQLNDTRYISKYAREYLNCICPKVWTVRGQTTSIFRHLLRYKKKDRSDFRNHAYDALIVGLVDRSFVKRISDIAKNIEGQSKERLENIGKALKNDIVPWDSFKKDIDVTLDKIIVSHRRRDKKTGALHKDTAYSLPSEAVDFNQALDVSHYVPVIEMEKANNNKIDKIISEKIKSDFKAELEKNQNISKEFILDWYKKTGIRRIRIKENHGIIPIKDKKTGKAFKAYKSDENYSLELYKNSSGKWDGQVINKFEANQKHFKSKITQTRLMKNDMLYFENQYWRLVKFDKNKIMIFTKHFVSGNPNQLAKKEETKKYVKKVSSISGLQKLIPKRIYISPCGKITKTALI